MITRSYPGNTRWIAIILPVLLILLWFPGAAFGQATATLDAASVRSMGPQVEVPVSVNNINDLVSGEFTINLPAPDGPVQYVGIRFSSLFDGGQDSVFTGFGVKNGQSLKVTFVSHGGAGVDFTSPEAICYLTFHMSESMPVGSVQEIPLEVVSMKNASGNDLALQVFSGEIIKNYPIGDVLGMGEVTSLSSSRVIQHVLGSNPITDPDALAAADVNADGSITMDDAMLILRYVSGQNKSFFTIKTTSFPIALRNYDYSAYTETAYGKEPCSWKITKGQLPRGLTLNTQTGLVSGKATRLQESTFTLRATDRDGYISERQFTIKVTDSNIVKMEDIAPVTARVGEEVTLPGQIKVTYRDGTTGYEPVAWESFDTAVTGTKTVKGTVGDSGLSITVEVTVIKNSYINHVATGHLQMLNIHTLVVDVSEQVFAATVNDKIMHYEGNNRFSLATTTLKSGSACCLKVFDRYGNLLESRQVTMP